MLTRIFRNETGRLSICTVEDCQRVVSVTCDHCQKQLCRRHFNVHADQYLQDLHPMADSINELEEKVRSFCFKKYKEQIVEQLNEWHKQTMKTINEFHELKSKQLDQLFQETQDIFERRTKNHQEIIDEFRETIRDFTNDANIAFKQLEILNEHLKELKDNIDITHHLVTMTQVPLHIADKTIRFHPKEYYFNGGGTLLYHDDQITLNNFYGDLTQNWKLIYKATQDGFKAEDFHRCCDQRGSTMTVIQSKTGSYLFGGYTELAWDKDKKYKSDPQAFLFTLKNPHKIPPTKFLKNPNFNNSVGHIDQFSVYFGGRCDKGTHFADILIFDNANTQDSMSNFPTTYEDTTGKGELLFTGKRNFLVAEIEVYSCAKKAQLTVDNPCVDIFPAVPTSIFSTTPSFSFSNSFVAGKR